MRPGALSMMSMKLCSMVISDGVRPRTFGGGRFAEQRQDAFVTELIQALRVGTLMVERVGIEAEVTGVNDAADWRVEHDDGAAWDGVRHAH